MGGLEGKALQEAFGFAPGSGGFAARTRCKTQTSRGPMAPVPPPGEFASSIITILAVLPFGVSGYHPAAKPPGGTPETLIGEVQEGPQALLDLPNRRRQ